jgi:hypothetical protein
MSNITQFTTGGVKSVQRGIFSAVGTYTTTTPTTGANSTAITISAVNPAKAVVTLAGGLHWGGTGITILYELISITATTLTVFGPFYTTYSAGPWYGYDCSWQVVEYY